MMEDIHIADGIAVKLLLAGLVLASGAVGALGLAHGTSQAAVTGAAGGSPVQLAFPIDNVSASAGSYQLSLDGKGNDPFPATFPIDNVSAAFPIDNVSAAFPIDNVSAAGAPWGVRDTDRVGVTGIGSADTNTWALAAVDVPDELPQDMDPY